MGPSGSDGRKRWFAIGEGGPITGKASTIQYCRPEAKKADVDTFYGLHGDTFIWEYDEAGQKFPIVNVPEGYKATLAYLDTQPMRQRYTVTGMQPIIDEEYDYIVNRFMNPKHWR